MFVKVSYNNHAKYAMYQCKFILKILKLRSPSCFDSYESLSGKSYIIYVCTQHTVSLRGFNIYIV
jgi:hypothetical protein